VPGFWNRSRGRRFEICQCEEPDLAARLWRSQLDSLTYCRLTTVTLRSSSLRTIKVLWKAGLPFNPVIISVHSPAGNSTANRPDGSAFAVTSTSCSFTKRRVVLARGVMRSSRSTRPWSRPPSFVRLATRSPRSGVAGTGDDRRGLDSCIPGLLIRGGSEDSLTPALPPACGIRVGDS